MEKYNNNITINITILENTITQYHKIYDNTIKYY